MVQEKHIRWGLIASTVLFAALMILFIILFATKHEDSSAFLLSYSAVAGSNSGDQVQKVKSALENKKFHVNSITVDLEGVTATALFSLRGDQKLSSVDESFSGFTNHMLSDGSGTKLSAVCHVYYTPVPTVGTTKTTPKPTADPTQYCKGDQREKDLVIVVDVQPNPPGMDGDNKTLAMDKLKFNIINGVDFSKTNVYIYGVNDNATTKGLVAVPNGLCSTAACFNTAWDHLSSFSATATGRGTNSLILDGVFDAINRGAKRPNVPLEVTLYLAHMFNAPAQGLDLRTKGAFVSVIQPTQLDIQADSIASTKTFAADSWIDAANKDLLAIPFCQYYYTADAPQPAAAAVQTQNGLVISSFMERINAVNVDLKCQKLDVLFVFDISQSVPEPLLKPYREFANWLQSQFTLTNAPDGDNVHVGIITFNETARVYKPLGQTNSNDLTISINSIKEYGGLTNTEDALLMVQSQLKTGSVPNHGKLVIFMTDGEPNTGNTPNAIKIGQQLTAQGVDIFFIGTGQYEAGDAAVLKQINGHPEWIYDNTDEAKAKLPTVSLQQFPCPVAICQMAYFAVEVSEITHGNGFALRSLNIVRDTVNKINQLKGNQTFYKLMLYNDGVNYLPDAQEGYSYAAMNAVLNNLISNDTYLKNFFDGHTDLTNAIIQLTADAKRQQHLKPYFGSVVMILGEANYYNLDPKKPNSEQEKKTDLTNAATRLKNTGATIYVVDGSVDPSREGDDLWNSVTPDDHRIMNSSFTEATLEKTTYYSDITAMSCEAPPRHTCFNSFHDISFVLDVAKPNDTFRDYLEELVKQFQTTYTSHFSLVGMGPLKSQLLMNLGAYDSSEFITDALANYSVWWNTTVNAPITRRTRTVLDDMLTTVYDQFGCGQYGDDKDRIQAPNTVVVISDRFGDYNINSWLAFTQDDTQKWCRDCASQPNFVFIDTSADPITYVPVSNSPPISIPPNLWNLVDPEAIRSFNVIVDTVCGANLPGCLSYALAQLCPV